MPICLMQWFDACTVNTLLGTIVPEYSTTTVLEVDGQPNPPIVSDIPCFVSLYY